MAAARTVVARIVYTALAQRNISTNEAWIVVHRSLIRAGARGSFARRLLVFLFDVKYPEEYFFPMLAWSDTMLSSTVTHHAMFAVFWHLNGL
eukprot:IDg15783t1